MKRIGFYALSVGVLCAGIGVARIAKAGDDVDCSRAEKWVKRTSSYDRNALVTYKVHSSDTHFHEFKCDAGYCIDEPTKTSSWKNMGECKSGTDPR